MSKKQSIVKPGPAAPPSKTYTAQNWRTWGGNEKPPKDGAVNFFGHIGPTTPGQEKPGQAAPVSGADYEQALKDPEFVALCRRMGIAPADAVKFHKLTNER